MAKRLLLVTAMGLALGTAVLAQNTADPSKTEDGKAAAAPAEKAHADKPRPLSRVEKWKADKDAELAEKNAAAANAAETQTPHPAVSASNAQPPMSASHASPSVGQAVASGASTAATTPATSTAAKPASITLSAGVEVTEQDRNRISDSVARQNVKSLRGVDFSVSVGSRVPRELRLYPLPADVLDIVPQYRGYRFMAVNTEIVIVEPGTQKIVTILPLPGAATATAQNTPASSEPDSIAAKPQAARTHKKVTRRSKSDDWRSANASAELRVGQRVPDDIALHDLPPNLQRELASPPETRGRGRSLVQQID